jgi:anaerobic magnesium-protoporphyrin IX monomethyl ester cyclase
MEEGCRVRSPLNIIEEIKLLKDKYGITYIGFYDELLMVSEERTTELCEALLRENLNIKWVCSGRLNFAKLNILRLMKKAGCTFINYGIESFDDNVLKNMNKCLTTKIIEEGVQNTLKENISPGLNFIFGNIGDNEETLKKSAEFLLKYNYGTQLRTIRPVTPYPGCPLYYYAIEKGLLKGVEDFYENKHVNSDLLSVNFTNLSDEEFYRALMQTNIVLIKDYYKHKMVNSIKAAKNLYTNRDENFRGFRVV